MGILRKQLLKSVSDYDIMKKPNKPNTDEQVVIAHRGGLPFWPQPMNMLKTQFHRLGLEAMLLLFGF